MQAYLHTKQRGNKAIRKCSFFIPTLFQFVLSIIGSDLGVFCWWYFLGVLFFSFFFLRAETNVSVDQLIKDPEISPSFPLAQGNKQKKC